MIALKTFCNWIVGDLTYSWEANNKWIIIKLLTYWLFLLKKSNPPSGYLCNNLIHNILAQLLPHNLGKIFVLLYLSILRVLVSLTNICCSVCNHWIYLPWLIDLKLWISSMNGNWFKYTRYIFFLNTLILNKNMFPFLLCCCFTTQFGNRTKLLIWNNLIKIQISISIVSKGPQFDAGRVNLTRSILKIVIVSTTKVS